MPGGEGRRLGHQAGRGGRPGRGTGWHRPAGSRRCPASRRRRGGVPGNSSGRLPVWWREAGRRSGGDRVGARPVTTTLEVSPGPTRGRARRFARAWRSAVVTWDSGWPSGMILESSGLIRRSKSSIRASSHDWPTHFERRGDRLARIEGLGPSGPRPRRRPGPARADKSAPGRRTGCRGPGRRRRGPGSDCSFGATVVSPAPRATETAMSRTRPGGAVANLPQRGRWTRHEHDPGSGGLDGAERRAKPPGAGDHDPADEAVVGTDRTRGRGRAGRVTRHAEPPAPLLARSREGRSSTGAAALGSGRGSVRRVPLQRRVAVHARPRADHAAERGPGPDRSVMRACGRGGERPDREQGNQPGRAVGILPGNLSPSRGRGCRRVCVPAMSPVYGNPVPRRLAASPLPASVPSPPRIAPAGRTGGCAVQSGRRWHPASARKARAPPGLRPPRPAGLPCPGVGRSGPLARAGSLLRSCSVLRHRSWPLRHVDDRQPLLLDSAHIARFPIRKGPTYTGYRVQP